MSRPTHLLKHEHRVIEQAMRALDGMCIRMKAGVSVSYEDLTKLLDFIHNFADCFHHKKEETLLFPALERLGLREESGSLAFLRDEHEAERRMLDELKWAIEDYRHNPVAGEKFITVALEFKDHLIGHMQQEDAVLFDLAEEMLDGPAKDSLTHIFAEENAVAREMIERYERIAGELENAWTV
jgi:hemerythrin-like domain-containing protein